MPALLRGRERPNAAQDGACLLGVSVCWNALNFRADYRARTVAIWFLPHWHHSHEDVGLLACNKGFRCDSSSDHNGKYSGGASIPELMLLWIMCFVSSFFTSTLRDMRFSTGIDFHQSLRCPLDKLSAYKSCTATAIYMQSKQATPGFLLLCIWSCCSFERFVIQSRF